MILHGSEARSTRSKTSSSSFDALEGNATIWTSEKGKNFLWRDKENVETATTFPESTREDPDPLLRTSLSSPKKLKYSRRRLDSLDSHRLHSEVHTLNGKSATSCINDSERELLGERQNGSRNGGKVQSVMKGIDCNMSSDQRMFISCNFLPPAVKMDEARRRWPHRYKNKDEAKISDGEDTAIFVANDRNFRSKETELEYVNHYSKANVDGHFFNLDDCVHLNAEPGSSKKDHVARILELFETSDKTCWCRLQWFYRPEDTVLAKSGSLVEDAGELHENLLFYSSFESDELLECLLSKARVLHLDLRFQHLNWVFPKKIYFYTMGYKEEYSTFYALPEDKQSKGMVAEDRSREPLLLDLYCGCGGMSTGLCMGARLRQVKMQTVYNCQAECFLSLIKKWDELCERFPEDEQVHLGSNTEDEDSEEEDSKPQTFEVQDILAIRWSKRGKSRENTIGHIQFKGECDVICGGPPCQGVSGKNLHRDTEKPLRCGKNKQVITYMDIVEFLKPRFMIMENVVDILRFGDGVVGRYALTRLVKMNYQAKLGLMAAGRYGVPQYRQRVFLWGAAKAEVLPAFPLPTHDVEKVRMGVPADLTKNLVWFGDKIPRLRRHITLKDALTDLPPIDNFEQREEMDYLTPPTNPFQRLLRKPQYELQLETKPRKWKAVKVLDHRPLKLNEDDLERTCLIPRRKGSSFRDLPGVKILPDGTHEIERENRQTCKSGKPLVPEYALTWKAKKNKQSFGRLWWDETVGTVCTGASPHGQRLLHPDQDRTLSVRECARLQGFPDYYKFCGSVEDRYVQVGNAVSVPIARALGYCLAEALVHQVHVRVHHDFGLNPMQRDNVDIVFGNIVDGAME
ncbi:hypothetical protein AXG93_2278s1540 [Marchantia polymorpha subsp. ruderalis]|uniref:DNA (cytosine-5-)-methyltransferase n=1 Tax=Marchantia polymorpha subsp. ruderalis TaxID=1480154 RepID=A0A176WGQ6_MARPO|nr:hypothetical protein AXG93_2278s1540 [Marchantia polymorpha subsp. ruderalis]